MKFKDLQFSKKPNFSKFTHSLGIEEQFIWHHGLFNCCVLKFKDANTVINIMNSYDPACLNSFEKQFILKNSNTEVLCYVCYSFEDKPDIFVFGDDNIAFQVECFV